MAGRKKIIIVREGGWGRVPPESKDYDVIAKALQRHLNRATKINSATQKEEKLADAEIVEKFEDALTRLKKGEWIDALIFISRGMLSQAKQVAKDFKRTKAVVWTGLIPRDEVILLEKSWADPELIGEIVLRP